jgi:serine phosphatase RsbU (regulator of sigma subunit)/anti-sigma regulatory factor (Ser/Thr protein kinase)
MTETQPLGGLLLAFDHEQEFGPDRQALLASFAGQVTQALHRERVTRAQVATAEALRRSLMPPSLPEPAGLALCARYQAGGPDAEVGGDWYDVFELADGSTAFAVGDVTGKGLPAAVVMGEVRTALRAYALVDAAPAAVLPRLERFVAARPAVDEIVTVIYGYISSDRSRLTWAVAGHPPPMLVPPDADPVLLDDAQGPALGLGGGRWREATVELSPGDTVFAFTDGLVHGRQVDVFAGIERLRQHFSELPSRRRRPRRLCSEARSAMATAAGWDDVTMLAVGCESESTREATRALGDDPTAVRTARRFVSHELAEWGLGDEAVETATLCASELVTNAVLHAGAAADVRVELDTDALTVTVTDHGGGVDGSALADVDAAPEDVELVSGRGLALVEALTSAWGSEQSPEGTTVWFELVTASDRPASATDSGSA